MLSPLNCLASPKPLCINLYHNHILTPSDQLTASAKTKKTSHGIPECHIYVHISLEHKYYYRCIWDVGYATLTLPISPYSTMHSDPRGLFSNFTCASSVYPCTLKSYMISPPPTGQLFRLRYLLMFNIRLPY